METITKTYRGVEMTLEGKPHGKKEMKFSISFALNGSGYKNAEVLPVEATDEQTQPALGKLEAWAQEIINDHKPKK